VGVERLVGHRLREIEARGRCDAGAHEAEQALGRLARQGRRRQHRDGPAVLGDDDARELARREAVYQLQPPAPPFTLPPLRPFDRLRRVPPSPRRGEGLSGRTYEPSPLWGEARVRGPPGAPTSCGQNWLRFVILRFARSPFFGMFHVKR
jgi:hypothetical protein